MHKSLLAILLFAAPLAFAQAGGISHVDPNHRTATQKEGMTTRQTENQAVRPGQNQNTPDLPGVFGYISDARCGRIHTVQPGMGPAGCARYCVDHGSHYILVSNDKIYQLSGDKKLLENFAGISVRVQGAVGGSSISVKEITPVQMPGQLVTPAVRQGK